MRPIDFQVPQEELAPVVHAQGLSYEALQELRRAQVLQDLRQKAARKLREWQRSDPKAKFQKDAEARIYEELLEEHEQRQAEAAAAREASARNAEERGARKAQAEEQRRQEIEDALGSATKAELVEVVRAYRSWVADMLHTRRIRQGDVPADLQ